MGFMVRMLNLSVLQGGLAGCCVIGIGQWIHICEGQRSFSVGFPTLKRYYNRVQESSMESCGKHGFQKKIQWDSAL